MPAATITEAIEDVVRSVMNQADIPAAFNGWQTIFLPGTLTTDLDENDPQQRTVRNWKIPSLWVSGEIPAAGAIPDWQSQLVMEVLLRTLNAVRTGVTNGYITAQQETDILAAWNLWFPYP